MTDEERQRQMDFIVAQQAKFAGEIQQLLEAHAASDKRTDALERGFVSLFNLIQEAVKNQRESAAQFNSQFDAIQGQITQLTAAQKESDERLNAFILVVERSVSERANGQKPRAAAKKSAAKKRPGRK